MIDIFEISKTVLFRLSKMNYEKQGGDSSEQLIFPLKIQAQGKTLKNRVSEQELRLLFIEEFKIKYPNLFYSIETPTVGKFRVGKKYDTIRTDLEGQSASHDMCVFDRVSDKYKRILNIEFKHRNSDIKNTGKDILKLMKEEQDGVFIHLLENTNSRTLISVFKKLYKSFYDHQANWDNKNKSIELVILSLKQKKLIYARIYQADLINLKDIFSIENGFGSIVQFKGVSWRKDELNEY